MAEFWHVALFYLTNFVPKSFLLGCSSFSRNNRQECPIHSETNMVLFRATKKLKIAKFSLKKGLDVDFRVMRDGKNVHFTCKRTRFLFHATN